MFTISLQRSYGWSPFWSSSRLKLLQVGLSIFDESSQSFQSNQKRKLLNFWNILRKSVATAFVFCCDAKHSDTLLGSSHLCFRLFLGGCGQK